MNRPSDSKVREVVQAIFNVQAPGTGPSTFEAQLKSRILLHHWPLSRVERLIFRSEELPTVIFKAVVEPLQQELDVYQDLFQENNRWTPTLYGSTRVGQEVWLFLEDVGARTFKSEPTSENLQRVTATLADLHVTFGREVANGLLQQRSHLKTRDYSTYLSEARQTLVLTRALVNKNLYPSITAGHLSKLEAVVNMYDRVAISLVGGPQTLVHGDFNPQNLIFSSKPDSNQVYIIDWANACIGPALIDLVDLANFVTANYGVDALPRLLQNYRAACQAAGGEPVDSESLEELFVCSQIEKKMGLMRWYDQCALKWIPTGVAAYNQIVSGLIEEVYELSTILL